MNEADWVNRAQNGDAEAFRRLYEKYVDRVFRLAYRMTGDEELARDCTQESFIRAYRKLSQFRGDSAFYTWLHTITTSVTLNQIRKTKRHGDRERDLEEARMVKGKMHRYHPGLRERLEQALRALPEKSRTIVLMHDVEGYKHEEIAEMLGMAVGTSKARLSRARAVLRTSLADLAEEVAG